MYVARRAVVADTRLHTRSYLCVKNVFACAINSTDFKSGKKTIIEFCRLYNNVKISLGDVAKGAIEMSFLRCGGWVDGS